MSCQMEIHRQTLILNIRELERLIQHDDEKPVQPIFGQQAEDMFQKALKDLEGKNRPQKINRKARLCKFDWTTREKWKYFPLFLLMTSPFIGLITYLFREIAVQ